MTQLKLVQTGRPTLASSACEPPSRVALFYTQATSIIFQAFDHLPLSCSFRTFGFSCQIFALSCSFSALRVRLLFISFSFRVFRTFVLFVSFFVPFVLFVFAFGSWPPFDINIHNPTAHAEALHANIFG